MATLKKVWQRNQPKAAADVASQFLAFMVTLGIPNPVLEIATPELVAQFLHAKELAGHTMVHSTDCTHMGETNRFPDCTPDCSRKAAAAATRSRVGTLRALFKNRGLVNRWSDTGGNPCLHPLVESFVTRVDLEQLEANVALRQAPLLTKGQFEKLVDAIEAGALEAHQRYDVAEWIQYEQDRFLFVLLWHTGLRHSDATRLHSQSVHLDATGRLSIQVGVTKTGRRVHHARTLTFEASDKAYDLPRTWVRYKSALEKFGLPLEPGHLFNCPKLNAKSRTRSWGGTFSWSKCDTRLAMHVERAGLPRSTKPHSFHGSHAKYDYESGVAMETTLHEMSWSSSSYRHYLRGRVVAPGKFGNTGKPGNEEVWTADCDDE